MRIWLEVVFQFRIEEWKACEDSIVIFMALNFSLSHLLCIYWIIYASYTKHFYHKYMKQHSKISFKFFSTSTCCKHVHAIHVLEVKLQETIFFLTFELNMKILNWIYWKGNEKKKIGQNLLDTIFSNKYYTLVLFFNVEWSRMRETKTAGNNPMIIDFG